MIDINELRRLAQTVQSPAYEINERASAIHKLHDSLPSGVVLELLDRLEEAESDGLEQARMNGMGASREAALMAKLEAAEKEVAHIKEVEFPRKARAVAVGWETKCARLEQERDDVAMQLAQSEQGKRKISEECDELRARIEAMEKQEPVVWMHESRRDSDVVTSAVKYVWGKSVVGSMAAYSIPLYALPGAQSVPDVDALAQLIREIDGKHQLSAGTLAERIVEWLAARKT